MSNFTRRKFIGSIPCMAIGTTTLYSSLINLKAMGGILNSSSSIGGDYKALVCILLNGGNDSYNMLVPKGNAEYAEYAAVRSNQAIPQDDLLEIDPLTSDGRTFGLNPSMTGIHELFQNGKVAFVSNVGTLVEPVEKSTIFNGSANLPLGLYSHIDQVMHWQTAVPQERSDKGWAGKVADIMQSMNENNGVSMNISLGGNNVLQTGNEVIEYAINNQGGVSIVGWDSPFLPFVNVMREDITDMMNKEYDDLFKDSYKGVLKRSIDSNEVFNAAIENVAPLTTQFGVDKLSQDLRMVADSIAARDVLGAKRQIFFVSMGGFDNHDELLNNHGDLMSRLDAAMKSFYDATEELGVADCVTSFTISDFARTLTSNGNGTDHAWGGNAMVMGGAVKGKEMYGTYPELALGSNLELGNGVLHPTTSADLYFAELALWFGIAPSELADIFPNLSEFYTYDPNTPPLEFLL